MSEGGRIGDRTGGRGGVPVLLSLAGLAGTAAIVAAASVGHGTPATPEAAVARRLVETGAHYLLLHAAALLGLAAAAASLPGRWWWPTAFLWCMGALAFSGGLILRGATGTGLGPVVPAGGAALIAGWAVLAVAGVARMLRR